MQKSKTGFLGQLLVYGILFTFFGFLGADAQGQEVPTLKYLGRSSVKIVTADKTVIYIDPYAGTDYSEPADLILVTHGHSDHNQIGKVTKKPETVMIAGPAAVPSASNVKFVKRGDGLKEKGIEIKAVTASNTNHPIDQGVGFVLFFDGIVFYHAGDTSMNSGMTQMAALNITYALLPVDGYYNMNAAMAMKCADLIKAKWNIPIHSDAEGDYNAANAKAFNLVNTIQMKPGDAIELKP